MFPISCHTHKPSFPWTSHLSVPAIYQCGQWGEFKVFLLGSGFQSVLFLQAIACTFTVLGDSLTRACEQAISKGEWFGAVARALVQKPQNSCDSGHNEDTDSRGETSVRDSKVVRVERSAGLNPAADHAHPRSYEFQGRVSDSSPSALSP